MYVALKEIRLQQEEGAPFTAIREGMLLIVVVCIFASFCQFLKSNEIIFVVPIVVLKSKRIFYMQTKDVVL